MREFFLLIGKPTSFACNVAESDLARVPRWSSSEKHEAVPPTDSSS